MAERSNKFNPKLKYYHIILISIILSPLLILNSNSLNKQREKEKILKSEEIILRKSTQENWILHQMRTHFPMIQIRFAKKVQKVFKIIIKMEMINP